MAGRTHLSPHLSNTELSKRARCAPNLVEARRWQLLALIADGKTAKAAAELVGLYPNYARRVVQRYNQEGPAGVRDRRLEQRPPAREPLLTAEQLQKLAEAVQGPAPGGGLWTGPLVAQWIAPGALVPELVAVTLANLVAAVFRFSVLRAWIFRPAFTATSAPEVGR